MKKCLTFALVFGLALGWAVSDTFARGGGGGGRGGFRGGAGGGFGGGGRDFGGGARDFGGREGGNLRDGEAGGLRNGIGNQQFGRDNGGALTNRMQGTNAASRVGALDLGLVPGAGGLDARAMAEGGVDLLFNLGADEIAVGDGPFVVYVGTHGDRGAHRADIILPGAAYTEKDATWVNTEGRVQYGRRATFPKGEGKEDWTILRALSAVIGKTLPYDSLAALRQKMLAAHPTFGQVDCSQPENKKIVSGKPYISVNSAITKALNAPKPRQSRDVCGLKKLNAKMMNTSELMNTRNHRP